MNTAESRRSQHCEAFGEGRREPTRRNDDEDLPILGRANLLERQVAFALRRTPVAVRQQLAQLAVGVAVGRVADCLEAVCGDQARADYEPNAYLFRRHMGANDASERVAIGDADG